MKTLYESILSSAGTGKGVIIKSIENYNFTPDIIKALEKTIAIYPATNYNIVDIVKKYIEAAGDNCSLNWIDTSKVTDMSDLFATSKTRFFDGDISKWDVSNVTDMSNMFSYSIFNGDISDWDVSNVKRMDFMFRNSEFNQDISNWDVSNVKDIDNMFYNCRIRSNYKPKFN